MRSELNFMGEINYNFQILRWRNETFWEEIVIHNENCIESCFLEVLSEYEYIFPP